MDRSFDVVVVGAGICGLSTAWWLLRRGVRNVALLERFAIGHDQGSSHGRSRITRTAYGDPAYVRLMALAHDEAWPALEADAGRELLHPRDGCFFGPRAGPFVAYLDAVAQVGADVEEIDPAEARRRFPMFRFPGDLAVLHDRTAAVVAAADTIQALAAIVRTEATVLEGVAVRGIDPAGPLLETDAGRIRAERIVVTAGSWAARLLPGLARTLTPIRQTVAYVDVPGAETFPVWAYKADDDFYYGLPEFQRPGAKAARHVLEGPAEDPDAPPGAGDVAPVLAFLRDHLAEPVRSVLATERCLYTVAPGEDFVLDRHPDSAAVVVGAGMSGHGFKFGPLVGRILAELALDGHTSVAPFEAERARFRWR